MSLSSHAENMMNGWMETCLQTDICHILYMAFSHKPQTEAAKQRLTAKPEGLRSAWVDSCLFSHITTDGKAGRSAWIDSCLPAI